MARNFFALLMLLALPASGADDGRISFLEQEVRSLHRDVQSLTRQIDELQSRASAPVARPVVPRDAAPASATLASATPQWLDAAKWRGLRVGMSELEVISTLGPPNTMRTEGGARTLFYALEIGPAGFLGGSVVLRDRAVAQILKPTLQ